MKEAILRRNIIILVAVTFLLLVAMSAVWFFLLVRPQREEIAKVEEEYSKRKAKADSLKSALEQERQAKDRLAYLKGQSFFFRGSEENPAVRGLYRRLYFGDINGNNPIQERNRQEVWRAWMNEYHYAYGPALQRELRSAADDLPTRRAPVLLEMPEIKVDAPPQKPEDVQAPSNGFLKPLSATNNGDLQVSVTGDFPSIVRFLERLNRSSFLLVVGNIKLEGYTPALKATFTITPYLVAAGEGVKLAGGQASGEAAEPGMEDDMFPDDEPPIEAEGSAVKIKNPRLTQNPGN